MLNLNFLLFFFLFTSLKSFSEDNRTYEEYRRDLFNQNYSYRLPKNYIGDDLSSKRNKQRKCMKKFTEEIKDMELENDYIIERLLALDIKVDLEFIPVKSRSKYQMRQSSLGKNLNLRVPHHPTFNWCDEEHRRKHLNKLTRSLKKELDKQFPIRTMDMLNKINEILASDLSIIEKCAQIEKLQDDEFGEYKLNEITGDIYKGKRKIKTLALKRELYRYFYKKRIGNKNKNKIQYGKEFCKTFSDCSGIKLGRGGRLFYKENNKPVIPNSYLTKEDIQSIKAYLNSKRNGEDFIYDHIIKGTQLAARRYKKGTNPVYVCLVNRLRGPSGEIKEIDEGCTRQPDKREVEDEQEEEIIASAPECKGNKFDRRQGRRGMSICGMGASCKQTFTYPDGSTREFSYHTATEYLKVFEGRVYELRKCPNKEYLIDGEVVTIEPNQYVENGEVKTLAPGEQRLKNPLTGKEETLRDNQSFFCDNPFDATRCVVVDAYTTVDGETGQTGTLTQEEIDSGVEIVEVGKFNRVPIRPGQYVDYTGETPVIREKISGQRYHCNNWNCEPCDSDSSRCREYIP